MLGAFVGVAVVSCSCLGDIDNNLAKVVWDELWVGALRLALERVGKLVRDLVGILKTEDAVGECDGVGVYKFVGDEGFRDDIIETMVGALV